MPSLNDVDFLCFEPAFMERIWGGDRLQSVLGFDIPPHRSIGEAWLLADHPVHESRVLGGPLAGRTLRQLMRDNAEELLGSIPKATPSGRFPLLLKILDARDVLSVQVHPDDRAAIALGEPDVGKTEMWHVWDAAPGSSLICGLQPGTDRASLEAAIAEGRVEDCLVRFEVHPGDSVFVPAGTVHAIGAGVLLSEIQQNSDITYRLYDFNRVDANGKTRELHIEKSLAVTDFASTHRGTSQPTVRGAIRCLADSPFFTCDLIDCRETVRLGTKDSFHILLPKSAGLMLETPRGRLEMERARPVLVPASTEAFTLSGAGEVLDHYVLNR